MKGKIFIEGKRGGGDGRRLYGGKGQGCVSPSRSMMWQNKRNRR